MLKKLKKKIGFIIRGIIGIKDNLFDKPEVMVEMFGKNISENSQREMFQRNISTIGKTVNGENILCYTFGKGEEKILYFGGIHGNEIGTVKLMKRWINYLGQIPCSPKEEELRLREKQIFIIPCLNIDGYKKALKNPDYFSGGRTGKANANNVDLNRNFPTSNWSAQSKLFAAGEYFDISGGDSPASEPEIKCLLELIEKENIKTIYTFHNCWGTVFAKPCRDVSLKHLENYSKLSGYRIYTELEWEKLCPEQKTGHMMVWAEEKEKQVIEVELKTRYGSEWKQNKKALIQSLYL